MSIITTTGPHEYRVGDYIELISADHRWWRRLLHAVLFLPAPQRTQRLQIKSVATGSTFTTQERT